MTYLTLNILFLGLALWFMFWVRSLTKARWNRAFWIPRALTFGVLMVFSIVFDNIMIGIGLVAYDTSKISGIYIGVAPIEDFFYTLVAVILLPSVWELMASGAKIKFRLPR